jgi:hypothetical protein
MADEPEDGGIDIASMLFDAPKNGADVPNGTGEQKVETGGEGDKGGEAQKPPTNVQPLKEGVKPGEAAVVPAVAPQAVPPAVDSATVTAIAAQGEAIKSLLEKSQQGSGEKAPNTPRFNVSLPDKLLTAMASEDAGERGAATNILVNNMLNFMWDNVQREMEARFGNVPKMIESHMGRAEQTRRIYDDFYQKYPNLNKPELMPVVQNVAKQIISAKGQNFTWNEAVRDEIGAAVIGLIKAAGGDVTTTPPAGKKPAPKETPFVAGKGNRGAGTGEEKSPFLSSIGM